jgi:phosphoribosylanthranilate isomerase
MIKIKVCGLCNSSNAGRIMAEVMPDFMGFIFYPQSPRYVGEKPDPGLFRKESAAIKTTGVFVNESNKKILDISVSTCLDSIQLHGNESAETCSVLGSTGLIIIKAFNVGQGFDFGSLNSYKRVCNYFLFDTRSDKPGGSSKKFDWRILEEYKLDKPFFLSGGIGPDDSDALMPLINNGLFAVDINSRFESSSGIKDVGKIKTFVKAIKNNQI